MQLEHILQAHGLIGRGGGKGKDNIPPPPITNFRATIVGETIKLTYSIPDDSDFIGLLIVGNNKGYPTGINDGDVVLNVNIEDGGTIPTEVIDENITQGVRRYYRAFPYDWDRNYNTDTGQQVSEIIKISQLAPSAPTMKSRTSTSITLNPIDGCEYRIDNGNWQDSNVFSGLNIATSYTFYARRKETTTHYASPSSVGATFTTDKGAQSAPPAPNVMDIEHDRATVVGITGTEVSIDGSTWYDSPHTFTGLSPETSYAAYARMKETNTHYASPISPAKEFTTPPEGDDMSGSPGSKNLIAGTMEQGYFGFVPASEFITGDALASLVGISAGTSQFSSEGWLKFAYQGKIQFVAKKPIRHSISWDAINTAGCVFGTKTVEIGGLTYKVRLMRTGLKDPMDEYNGASVHGSEWNKLMLPIHIKAKDGSWAYPDNVEANVPYWGIDFTDEDLLTHNSFGSGSYSWCQDTYSSYRVLRGIFGVSYAGYLSLGTASSDMGWRPVLELVA